MTIRTVASRAAAPILLALLATAAQPAAASDPAIESPAGGLAFAANPSLKLEQQDVLVTADRITITYTVRNDVDTPQSILITFALPDLDANAANEDEIVLPAADAENFVGGRTTVDGQPITLTYEQRAMALGLDISTALRGLALPLLPYASDMSSRLEQLPPPQRLDLLERGILKEDGTSALPSWTLKTVGYWRQSLGPRQSITIVQAYRPIASIVTRGDESLTAARKRNCLSPAQESAIAKLPVEGSGTVSLTSVTYAVTPGGDGLGPARRFRLIVEANDPTTVIASCRDGLKRTGPLQFDWSASDYVLDEEFHLLFAR